MAKAAVMTLSVEGAEVSINYNEANRRITTVDWVLPTNVAARVRIWNIDIDPVVPIYENSYGAGAGSENVPGNYRVQLYTDEGGSYYDLPPNIQFIINMQTIG